MMQANFVDEESLADFLKRMELRWYRRQEQIAAGERAMQARALREQRRQAALTARVERDRRDAERRADRARSEAERVVAAKRWLADQRAAIVEAADESGDRSVVVGQSFESTLRVVRHGCL